MNRADRIRKLRALIADPATFEGERDNARAMLARLEAAEPEPAEHGREWTVRGWEPWYDAPPMSRGEFRDEYEVEFKWYDPLSAQSFEEIVRAFRKAAGARADDETGDRTWTFR